MTRDLKPWIRPSLDRPATLDVGARRSEILALARRCPEWRRCLAAGIDREDLEQEILCRFHARQSMPSRYDPSRSGFGRYCTLLARSVMRNELEKTRTMKAAREQVGAVVDVDGEPTDTDASRIAVGEVEPWHRQLTDAELDKLLTTPGEDEEPGESDG